MEAEDKEGGENEVRRSSERDKSDDEDITEVEKRIVAPFRGRSVRKRACQFTEKEKAAKAKKEEKKSRTKVQARQGESRQPEGRKKNQKTKMR